MKPNALSEFDAPLQQSPEWLQTLLAAELAAGNEVTEVFHSFPAPPAGACFRLAKPLITRSPQAEDGLDYYLRNTSLYSGELTDSQRKFFVIEPPLPPPEEPDMNAIRANRYAVQSTTAPDKISATQLSSEPSPISDSLVARFKSSMVMDYEKWHDGIGYEVNLLAQMNEAERAEVEKLLIYRSNLDWYDIEALAVLNTPDARSRLAEAIHDDNYKVRQAVQDYAPDMVPKETRTESLVQALKETNLYGGLSQAIDEAAEFHPPEVIRALLDRVRHGDGESATLIAGLLFYIHGLSDEPFDMQLRPFFLRFHTEDQKERSQAFSELCERIGIQER